MKTSLRSLKIPAANLIADLQYTFKVIVKNSYQEAELTKSALVKKLSLQQKQLDSLGTDNQLISVTPERGVSGYQRFTAKYVLDNVQALKRCSNWKYTITVYINSKNKIQLSSSKPNDFVDFIVPGSETKNQTVKITFTVANQEEYYSATRTVYALQNKNYDPSSTLPLAELR